MESLDLLLKSVFLEFMMSYCSICVDVLLSNVAVKIGMQQEWFVPAGRRFTLSLP